MDKEPEKLHRIRPSARLIRTIGKDLVKDRFAAIVELVKNAYDADSETATVVLCYDEESCTFTVAIKDTGQGMTLDDVLHRWLVPATPDKLRREYSYNGRRLQGRKGIGRFAAAALGDAVYLNTRAENSKEVSLLLDFMDFSDDRYLDEVGLEVDAVDSDRIPGTDVEISSRGISPETVTTEWGARQRAKLHIELQKLLAPSVVSEIASRLGYAREKDTFSLYLEYQGLPDCPDEKIKIEPVPLVDMYDYRIHGEIDSKGLATVRYKNQNVPSLPEESFEFQIPPEDEETRATIVFPGGLSFDLRVFDREKDSIQNLIDRGLRDPITNEPMGISQARKLLDEYYGVSLFRGSFRIRPYGDQEYDWLELDKKRVQKPKIKIGHNQVIGFVLIGPEEDSGLEEKSARDGLVQNASYEGLKYAIQSVLTRLEGRRRQFRVKSGSGERKNDSLDSRIDDLFDLKAFSNSLHQRVRDLGLEDEQRNSVVKAIDEELGREELRRDKNARELRDTIALYQGQATLGRITHILVHESKIHLKSIGEIPPRLGKWCKQLMSRHDKELEEMVLSRADTLAGSSKALIRLFKSIEPLAITRNPTRGNTRLRKEIESCIALHESEIRRLGIEVLVDIPEDMVVYGSRFDLHTIFSNLIDNSVFWLGAVPEEGRGISISATSAEGEVEVLFSDTGPGFEGTNLDQMFEPGYSMKPNGTGLGLAIAGEFATRLGGSMRAADSDSGARFEIWLVEGKPDAGSSK